MSDDPRRDPIFRSRAGATRWRQTQCPAPDGAKMTQQERDAVRARLLRIALQAEAGWDSRKEQKAKGAGI